MNLKNLFMTFMLSTTLSMGAQDMKSWPVPVGPISEMSYSSDVTHFSVWSPSAEQAKVNLYHKGKGGVPFETYSLSKKSDGTWSVSVKADLKGVFYTFQVQVDGQWLPETQGIFAKAVGINGERAQVIDMNETDPVGWNNDQRPPLSDFSDVVVYEMHHRDFSIDTESGVQHKGKFLALTESGTKNAQGLSTGIDHLK
ncbi:MAG: type I pullulanase, partial [Bacteroidaceae bacterium]|nr:type I pullulanase [Bacteroidaceae bacterium]